MRLGNIDPGPFRHSTPHPRDVVCVAKERMSAPRLSQAPFVVLPFLENEEVLRSLDPNGSAPVHNLANREFDRSTAGPVLGWPTLT